MCVNYWLNNKPRARLSI